jgi:hypothetical protein
VDGWFCMQLTPKQKLVLVWLLAIAIFWLIYLSLRHQLIKPKKVYAIDVAVMSDEARNLIRSEGERERLTNGEVVL